MTWSLSGVGASLGICEWMKLLSELCQLSFTHFISFTHKETLSPGARPVSSRRIWAANPSARLKNSFRFYLFTEEEEEE